MSIEYIKNDQKPALRIFRLDNYPSVLAASIKTSFSNLHEANAKGSPAIAALLTRFRNQVESVEIAAIGGSNGVKKVDLVAVTFKDAEEWKTTPPEEISALLEERLQTQGTIIIVPDMRQDFNSISIDDMRRSIKMYRPETVIAHNKENTDGAIFVPENGWNPKEKALTCVFGEECASGKCGDVSKKATQHMLHKHLLTRYPGIKVNFLDRKVA